MQITSRLKDSGLAALEGRIALYALNACQVGATKAVTNARQIVSEIHGTGVQYPGQPNRSSAPGQAPQSQHGDLVETIRTEVEDVVGIGVDAVAGDGSGIATDMEAGTSRNAPRLFMAPSAEVGFAAAESRLKEIGEELTKG